MSETPFLFKAAVGDDQKSVTMNAVDWQLYFGNKAGGDLNEVAAYDKVSWVRRCVDLRANALSSIPIRITRQGGQDEVEWPGADSLPALLWLASASLQVYGASYWVRSKNAFGIEKGYRWLVPTTITPKTDTEKGLLYFERQLPNTKRRLAIEDVVYIWQPSLVNEAGPGKGWVTTALTAAGLAKNADAFAADFFARGAIPAVVLSVEGSPPAAELERLTSWWKRLVGGSKGAWETVAVKASVKPQVIGYPTKDLAMSELVLLARQQIATAAGVPQTMLEDAANYATASEHHQAFYEETVVPEAVLIENALNEQIFAPQGLELTLDWQSLDIFQADEAERSASLLRLTQAEVPLPMAMEMLGFDLPNGMTYDQFEAKLEADRARKFTEQQALMRAQQQVEAEEPRIGPLPAEPPELETRAVRDELDRWRRKALSALKAGESPDVAFETDIIGESEQKALHEALAAADCAACVRAVFDEQVRALGDKVTPTEAVILEAPDEVEITEDDIERAIERWDRVMPAEFRGLLDAEVEA